MRLAITIIGIMLIFAALGYGIISLLMLWGLV